MICFPNAKINLGLHITEKRSDGFHNLETVFFPVNLHDSLEFVESSKMKFDNSGFAVDCPAEKNLCLKAYNALKKNHDLPPLHIHLHKAIPFGAGLGGGSADAAFMLSALNRFFKLEESESSLKSMAAEIGSDCAFFIENKPAYATGRGEILEPIEVALSGKFIVLVKPDIHISTAEAFAGIIPQKPEVLLKECIKSQLQEWKNCISNDFEQSLFPAHPILKEIKDELYSQGAVYASMSGSGSTIFGIFENKTAISNFDKHFVWSGLIE